MLFTNQRKHHVSIPTVLDDGTHPNITFLIHYLVENVMRDQRTELFVLDGHV